jgi:glycolate oxidase FAD binding subunit
MSTAASVGSALDELATAAGGSAVEAGEGDAVAGVRPSWVATPGSTEEAAAVLRVAAARGLRVVVRGRGTALHWGVPPRGVDLVVGTDRLDQVVEHVAGDLVCVVDAGTTIDALNAEVGQHGQQLALDQPLPGSSVAGAMATTRSGPRRLLYGTPRDQVLGITMVRPDGVVAKAGGKVVKNVAGYDIAKLLGGAYGTLGLVTRMVVRLHPLPPESRWMRSTLPLPAAASAALALTGSQLAPSAVEVRRQAGADEADVLVLLEGTRRGVDARSEAAAEQLGQGAQAADVATADLARIDAEPADVVVKVAVPLTGLTAVLAAARDVEQRHQVNCRVQGSAGAGVLMVVLSGGSADDTGAAVEQLRSAATGGSAVVLQAPDDVREQVDSWGPVGGLDLMRRVKDEFDPDHRFAPGRFVGGI